MLLIENLTKTAAPKLPFAKAAAACLTPDYELSLVFVDNKKARELNLEHRGKDYSANILSFPLGEKVGEIFLNLDQTEHDLLFLFIHGALHLKGMTHGSKMESEERKILQLFHGQKNTDQSRRRHRLDPHSGNGNRRRQ